MRKKSQVKFGETFGVIIIVYLVIVIGFNWYNKHNNESINELIQNDKYERAFEIYYYIINSDLIHVSERGIIDNEFDIISLRTFAEFSTGDNREFLRKQLGESTINISIYNYTNVYNNNFEAYENIILYDNQPENFETKEVFRTLIPIINKLENRIDLGLLEVYVYLE